MRRVGLDSKPLTYRRGARTRQLEALKDRWTAGSPESGAAASRALLEAVAQSHRLAILSRELQGLPPVDASRSAMVRAKARAVCAALSQFTPHQLSISPSSALRRDDLERISLSFVSFGSQMRARLARRSLSAAQPNRAGSSSCTLMPWCLGG